jgi:hypothetical protein
MVKRIRRQSPDDRFSVKLNLSITRRHFSATQQRDFLPTIFPFQMLSMIAFLHTPGSSLLLLSLLPLGEVLEITWIRIVPFPELPDLFRSDDSSSDYCGKFPRACPSNANIWQ